MVRMDDGRQLFTRGDGGVSGGNALPQRIIFTLEVNDVPGSFEKVKALNSRCRRAAQAGPEPRTLAGHPRGPRR